MKVYLFDWGDTLMVDFPGVTGKMCDWETVIVVDGAEETLKHLSKKSRIFIATGAANSAESDIKKAFMRVGLSQYISGYFCEANIGIPKGSPEFLQTILNKIKVSSEDVAMVGDSLVKDIEPAAAVGIKPIWLSQARGGVFPENTQIIGNLRELCI